MIIPPNMVTIGFDPFPKSSNNMPIHIDHTSIYIYYIYTKNTDYGDNDDDDDDDDGGGGGGDVGQIWTNMIRERMINLSKKPCNLAAGLLNSWEAKNWMIQYS